MARHPAKPPASPANAGVHERIDAGRNRQRILRATARLVRERRIDDVSMDDIASAAGVGIATVYRRFGDRDGLLMALSEGPALAFQNALVSGAPPLGPSAPPRERLIAFGVRSYALLSEIGRFISTKDHESGSWYNHPVYAVQKAYVGPLMAATASQATPFTATAPCPTARGSSRPAATPGRSTAEA
jgi:AcrR family transcriptional regulator